MEYIDLIFNIVEEVINELHITDKALKAKMNMSFKKCQKSYKQHNEFVLSIVEEILDEYLTVSNIQNAAKNAIKTRMQEYKNASTPEEKKRLGDRVDRAVKIKDALTKKRYEPTAKADSAVRNTIKRATMSAEEKREENDAKAIKRQQEVNNMWNQIPSHNRVSSPNGFKYGAKLKTSK